MQWTGRRTVLAATAAAVLGAAVGPAGVEAARKAATHAFITNDAKHPVSVKGSVGVKGTVPVKGTVAVAGTVPVAGKVDTSGSKVDVSGSKVDASGSKVDVSGSKVDASGSKVDVSGSTVKDAPQIPFESSFYFDVPAGQHYAPGVNTGLVSIPQGKTLIVKTVSVQLYDLGSGSDLPLDVSLYDGSGTGATRVHVPMVQEGALARWTGTVTDADVPYTNQAFVYAYRAGTTGNVRVEYTVSGYMVDTAG
jgi:hypothetical protein